MLTLEYDTLLALAGAVDIVVREYVEAHPQHNDAIIRFFRAVQHEGFEDWDRLRGIIEKDRKVKR